MATPGGKKPNKQQINDAGNEIGLDLANAIGKAISQKLGSFDFTPIAKSLSGAVGKVAVTVDTSSISKEINKLNPVSLQALVTEVDTSLVGEEISKLNPLALQGLIAEVDSSALSKIPTAQIQATVGEIQKPTRSVEDLFGPTEITPTIGKIDYDPTELVQTIKKSFMNLNTTLSILGSTLRNGIGSSAFKPAIESAVAINRQASVIDTTFSGVVDNVETLKKELKDSAAVQEMLGKNADLYSEINTNIASTYADLTKASKQELQQAAQKLGIVNSEKYSKQELVGIVGDTLAKLQEEKNLVDSINSSYGDMERSMKQVEADIKLKNIMIQTGLTGEYAETARLKQLQLEQGSISKEEYATALNKLKAEHHIYEEKAKQLELTESLAAWQLELREELENYEKGWEKTKSKIKAVLTDKEVRSSFLSVVGLEKIREGMSETVELFGEFRKEGLSVSQATKEMGLALGATFSLSGMSLKENAEIMAGMREQMGSMHHITSDTVTEVGKMAKTFGISAAEAGKLQGQFQNMPGATAESATNTLEFAGNLAKAAHVAPGDVMKDIAGNSESVAAYTKDGGKNIATAAVAAKKLGVEFGTLTKMSEGLLDFESSINKQMEASLLLGRSINLDKARQAALNGDIVGATQEMLANVGGEAEFNKMNVLQRKALADAMGVSVGELSKMVKHQDELKNLTEEQQMALATGEVTMDEILANAGGVASRFKDMGLGAIGALTSISQIRHGLKDTIGLVKDAGVGIKDFGAGFKAAREDGAGLFKGLIAGAKEFMGFGGKIKEVIPGADTLTEKATDTVKEKATDLVQDKATSLAEDKAGDLADKAADKGMEKVSGVAEDKAADLAEKAAEGTDKVGEAGEKVGKPGMMQGFKDNMKSLADGFKEMGTGKVIAGIFNTMIAGPALVVALPAIPFLLFMGKVALNQLATNFTNLSSGLAAMASTFVGSAALAAFSLASIPSIAAIPFLLFMGLTPLAQLATNFTNLSAGLTAMSASFIGSAALAAFGLAAIPAVASIPFLLFMGLTPLAQLATNLGSLGTGLTMMAGSFVGSAALAAFGLAAIIATPSLVFLAGIALLGAVGAAGLVALGAGLEILGGAAATGLPFLAIGLIAALGASMIPFAAALAIATPAIGAFGNIVIGIFQQIPSIIAAVAAGFVTIFGALADNWQILIPVGIGLGTVAAGLGLLGTAGLLAFPGLLLASVGLGLMQMPLLAINAITQSGAITQFAESLFAIGTTGPGLLLAGAGLLALGAAGFFAFPGLVLAGTGLMAMVPGLFLVNQVAQVDTLTALSQTLTALSAASGGLAAVSASLFGIAGGLAAITLAGISAMPIIGALVGLAAVAPALASIGSLVSGGGGEQEAVQVEAKAGGEVEKDDSMKILIEEIRGLRAEIAKGGTINMDGRKVGEVVRLAMNTSGVR